jgi:hypothetical protein
MSVDTPEVRDRFERLPGNRWHLIGTAAVLQVRSRFECVLDYPAELTDRRWKLWPDLVGCTPAAARTRVVAWFDDLPAAAANAVVWQPGERYVRYRRDSKGGLELTISMYEVAGYDGGRIGIRLGETKDPADARAFLARED